MSAPLNLSSSQLRDLATALEALTKIRKEHHVSVTPYSGLDVGIGETTVRVDWDLETERYVVDDRSGA